MKYDVWTFNVLTGERDRTCPFSKTRIVNNLLEMFTAKQSAKIKRDKTPQIG